MTTELNEAVNDVVSVGLIDKLTSNKLLGVVLAAVIAWGTTTAAKVTTLETHQAVQQEQIDSLKSDLNELKQDTKKILWHVLPESERGHKP